MMKNPWCAVCKDAYREDIDERLARRGVDAVENLREDYPHLTKKALKKHSEQCIPESVRMTAQLLRERRLLQAAEEGAQDQALAEFSSYRAFAARVIRFLDEAEDWLRRAKDAADGSETQSDANTKFNAAMSSMMSAMKLQASANQWTAPAVAVAVQNNTITTSDMASGMPAEAMKIVFEELTAAGQDALADRIAAKLAGFQGDMIDVTPDGSAA